MPGPLDALRKAHTIGAGPSEFQETGQKWLDAGVEGLRGALSSFIPGVDVPEGTAGGIGATLGAAAPLIAPHPAISELLKVLRGNPEELNPMKLLANDKVGGFNIPHRSLIVPPEGFELPSGTSPFPARDADLVDQYVARQTATPYKGDTKYGSRPSNSKVAPAKRTNFSSLDKMPADFFSKYSGTE